MWLDCWWLYFAARLLMISEQLRLDADIICSICLIGCWGGEELPELPLLLLWLLPALLPPLLDLSPSTVDWDDDCGGSSGSGGGVIGGELVVELKCVGDCCSAEGLCWWTCLVLGFLLDLCGVLVPPPLLPPELRSFPFPADWSPLFLVELLLVTEIEEDSSPWLSAAAVKEKNKLCKKKFHFALRNGFR